MQPVLTAAQMAQLDSFTTETIGLDGRILMSNAARATLDALQQRWPQTRRLLILSGLGNNGGDGLALAFYAHQRGLEVNAAICSPDPFVAAQLSPDCGYFYEVCKSAYVPVETLHNAILLPELITRSNADVIVDALFGTGLRAELGEFHVELIKRLNMTRRPVVAVDLPTGLACDSGVPCGAAVEADLTVTFCCAKLGLFHPSAGSYAGDVTVADIGLGAPSEVGICPGSLAAPDLLWQPLRGSRRVDTHKGDYGKLLVVAGHSRYPGAPRLAAEAALRMGAGLVRLVVPESIYGVCCANPALMVAPHSEDGTGGFAGEPDADLMEFLAWSDALVIGPGLGDNADEFCRRVLQASDLPTVVDADAMGSAIDVDPKRRWPLLFTPHPGELGRLTEMETGQVLATWFETIQRVASGQSVYLLAKASQSVLATPEGDLFFPRPGHPALAVGGSGDVLAGMLGALLARLHVLTLQPGGAHQRKLAFVEAVLSAVNVHSEAASLLAEELGDDGVTPTDLIDALPLALRSLMQCRAL